MENNRLNKDLLWQYEILHARQEVIEYYLRTVVREVYENIGQVLSLVRMRLSILDPEDEKKQQEIQVSGNLVGQVIHDLRKMCKNFYISSDTFTTTALIETLKHEMRTHSPDSRMQLIKVTGIPPVIEPGINLILCSMLLGIFERIKSAGDKIINTEINFDSKQIDFIIDHKGDNINWMQEERHGKTVNFFKKTELIGGHLKLKNVRRGISRIKLAVPL